MTFQDPWYRYPKGGIDTLLCVFQIADSSSHFRGTDTLNPGTDTHFPEWQNWLEKHPQRLQTRKGDESISELVEIHSGEAKVVDVELG
ncbi:hypothetical protein GQ457_06G005110 [Hibiscus cannabinus]